MGHTLDQTSSALSPKCKFENVEHKTDFLGDVQLRCTVTKYLS